MSFCINDHFLANPCGTLDKQDLWKGLSLNFGFVSIYINRYGKGVNLCQDKQHSQS